MTEPVSKEKLLEQAKKYIDEGRTDRAIQEYKKIVATDPRDYRVQIRIAELYVRQKQVGEAVKMYQEVASAYAGEGFYLKAVTVYKNVLKLNPSLRDVNSHLADLYEKMGLNQDAIHQYQILVSVYEQRGDLKGVLDLRRRIVALDHDNVTNRLRLAEAYQLDGQEHASLQEYETLAEQLKGSGPTDQLIDLYEKILTRKPDNLELLRRLCAIYYKQGEYKKALRRIEASQAVASKDTELLEMQSDMYFRQNQMETAKGKWRELAELYHSLGAVAQALDTCEKILVAAPEEVDALGELVEQIKAGATDELKRKAEAKRLALAKEEEERETLEDARKEAAEHVSAEQPPAAIVSLSKSTPAMMARKQPAGGVSETALHDKAKASEDLALMYDQMGLADEAVAERTKALEVYRRLLIAGVGGTDVLEKVRTLEQLVGEKVQSPPPAGYVVPQPKEMPGAQPPHKVETAGIKKEPPKKPPQETPPAGSSKKRISFV